MATRPIKRQWFPSFGGYYIMDNGTITTDGGQFYDDGGPTAVLNGSV